MRKMSLFRRPPTFALAAVDPHKPAVCLCRPEQPPIAVAAVGILAEPTRTIRRHRTTHQRQARCLAQQVGPPHDLRCRCTAHNARCDLDGAEVACAAQPLTFEVCCGFLRGLFGPLAKQPFQHLNHEGLRLIGLSSKGLVKTCAICPPQSVFFFPRATKFSHDGTMPQAQRVRSQSSLSIAIGASQHVALS
jgi:hypothetical protein